jgi:deoxyadenosine/deoxycytidine kinase
MDRSIYSDPIFAELYLQKGHLNHELFDNLTNSLRPPDNTTNFVNNNEHSDMLVNLIEKEIKESTDLLSKE